MPLVFPISYFWKVQIISMRRFICLCAICLVTGIVTAQEVCYLGVGGQHQDIIKKVFELNEEQAENLKNWSAELKYRNEMFKLRAEGLLKNNAQASPEDLLSMSFKYKALLDSMQANLYRLDKRLLSTFSKKQYHIYMSLCQKISRTPIYTGLQVDEK